MPSNKLYQLNFYTDRELEQLGSYPSDMSPQSRGRKGSKDSGEPKKTERISERLTDLVDNAVQKISKIQDSK